MLSFLYVEINAIAFLISIVILHNQGRILGNTRQQKLFSLLLLCLMLILITDSAMWVLDGRQFLFARQLLLIVTYSFYLANSCLSFIWFLFTIAYFNYQCKWSEKFRFFLLLPLIIHLFCTLLNMKYGFLYRITEQNVYQRGELILLNVVLTYLYVLASVLIAIINYRKSDYNIRKQEAKLMMSSLILPATASVIQMAYYGVSLVGISIAISMLIVFINFQNQQISTDSLTQLNNRYQFDNYIHTLASESSVAHALIMIDIDKFKSINDTYGHTCGDRVLIAVSDLLRQSCCNTHSFLCRYGGDEFAIICETIYTDLILCQIYSKIDVMNQSAEHPFPLSLSMGYTEFSSDQCSDFKQVVDQADLQMYQNKTAKCNC